MWIVSLARDIGAINDSCITAARIYKPEETRADYYVLVSSLTVDLEDDVEWPASSYQFGEEEASAGGYFATRIRKIHQR